MPSDLSLIYSLFVVSGANSFNFLQGQLTCDLRLLDQQPSLFGSICDLKGRIITTLYVAKNSDHYYLILPRAVENIVLEHLNKYAKISRVVITPQESLKCYGFWKDDDASTQILNDSIQISQANSAQKILVFSTDTIENLSSSQQWQLENILNGYFLIYPETTGLFTPHWLNLPELGAVSFNKGCYLGQEIIARTQYLSQSQKRFIKYYLLSSDTVSLPGDKIYSNDGKEIGNLIDFAPLDPAQNLLAVLLNNSEATEIFWNNYPLKIYSRG